MRCDNQPHNRMLERLRHPNTFETRLDLDYIRQLKTLCSQDLKSDPNWLSALLVVNGNKQRYLSNTLRSISWSRHHRSPRFLWPIPIGGVIASRLDEQTQEHIYDNYTQLTGIFVAGLPAYLTKNINPTRGLSNGTAVTLEALTLHPEEDVHPIIEQLFNSNSEDKFAVQLQFPPTYIYVAITNSKPGHFVGIPNTKGRIIIPHQVKEADGKTSSYSSWI